VLSPAHAAEWARRFGVADAQVRLDHLLSHLLLGVASAGLDDVVFLGGTALCRTYLVDPPWVRVSEDLDLLVVGDYAAVTERFERRLPRLVRREYPDAAWTVAPTRVRAPAPAQIAGGGANVRVQLLPGAGEWSAWRRVPVEHRDVDLRYDDTPGAVALTVPTLEGFAAMKLSAWEHRLAARDLFDLAGLATLGAFNDRTADIFVQLCARPPEPRNYRRLPAATRARWYDQLGHQTAEVPDPAACLATVAAAVDAMVSQ
jgi:predicted nucleotidyltransferase component of viral defense system